MMLGQEQASKGLARGKLVKGEDVAFGVQKLLNKVTSTERLTLPAT